MATIRLTHAPPGFLYRPAFLTPAESSTLTHLCSTVPLTSPVMRGVAAKRRTAHFGYDYGYESWRLSPAPPLPDFLLPLRERLAALAQVPPTELVEALITEYPAGAGIGWHRDAPMFGPLVAAVSLLSECPLRFRRRLKRGASDFEYFTQDLEPGSAYILESEARQLWQHSIAGCPSLRYSITFRMLKGDTPAPSTDLASRGPNAAA